MQKARYACVGSAIVLLVAACGGGGGGGSSSPAPQSNATTLSCSDFASIATPLGVLSNNVWNKQAAGNFAWSQCLAQRDVAGVTQFGWSWSWPASRSTIYAYPELIVGAKPWDPGPGSDARFPRQIATTNHLLIGYDVDVDTTGDHNLAASIWLIRTPTVANPPDPSAVLVEIMIWTESTFQPGGTKLGEVQIDGQDWEVWLAKNWGDASGTNSNTWTYMAYRAKTPTRTISYDARKLIADAISRGLVTPDLYIADVELGNEIMSGSGSTFIKSFGVSID